MSVLHRLPKIMSRGHPDDWELDISDWVSTQNEVREPLLYRSNQLTARMTFRSVGLTIGIDSGWGLRGSSD